MQLSPEGEQQHARATRLVMCDMDADRDHTGGRTVMTRWRQQGGFTLMELMFVVAIVGLLAAIAIPTFLKFKARANRAEVVANLSGIFQAETSFFGEQGRYGSLSEIGFQLAGVTNQYTYRSPATGGAGGSAGNVGVDLINPAIGPSFGENTVTPSAAAVGGGGGVASFTATATANIDKDATIDQWHVNDAKQGLRNADVDDIPL